MTGDESDRYFLVSQKNLLSLLYARCGIDGCDLSIDKINSKISCQGAVVTFTLVCLSGHSKVWSTSDFYDRLSPNGRKRSVLNVKICSYLLLTGHNYEKIQVGYNGHTCVDLLSGCLFNLLMS